MRCECWPLGAEYTAQPRGGTYRYSRESLEEFHPVLLDIVAGRTLGSEKRLGWWHVPVFSYPFTFRRARLPGGVSERRLGRMAQ